MEEKTYIFEGKTSTEAIEKGLKELNKRKNQVEIKVLEDTEKKTFFSILAPKVVKVEITIKENQAENREYRDAKSMDEIVEEIDNFVKSFISKLPTNDLKYIIEKDGNLIKVDINDEKASYLIGYRGETLNSLQSILSNIASSDKQEKVRVLLNISNYREKREQDLKSLANKISESVIKTRKSITLEPMVAFDRKVIHTALQDSDKVKTYSIGKEPYRKVVVSLK